jgi:hypothetical protein
MGSLKRHRARIKIYGRGRVSNRSSLYRTLA